MSDSTKILVTGATGNAGRAVANALIQRGFNVTAGSTRPSSTVTLPGAKAVTVRYEEPDTFDAALEGVSGVFLIAPPMDPDAPTKLAPKIRSPWGYDPLT